MSGWVWDMEEIDGLGTHKVRMGQGRHVGGKRTWETYVYSGVQQSLRFARHDVVLRHSGAMSCAAGEGPGPG